MNWLKDAKALVASIIALIAALILVAGTITDYARLPKRAANIEASLTSIEARLDTLANASQDLRLFLCMEMAEEDSERLDCLARWKESEVRR
jgi:hypothetical protein